MNSADIVLSNGKDTYILNIVLGWMLMDIFVVTLEKWLPLDCPQGDGYIPVPQFTENTQSVEYMCVLDHVCTGI